MPFVVEDKLLKYNTIIYHSLSPHLDEQGTYENAFHKLSPKTGKTNYCSVL